MKKHGLLIKRLKKPDPKVDRQYPGYDAIAMMYNHVILSTELCDNYTRLWSKAGGIEEDDLSNEQKERIVMITRDTFIHSMSSCEYCAKQIVVIKNHPDFKKIIDALNVDKNIYLLDIMGKSKSLGLTSEKEYNNWDCFREIRNAIVHNNAVVRKDKEYDINGFILKTIKDKQIHSKWDIFPYLVSIIADQYSNWVDNLYNH